MGQGPPVEPLRRCNLDIIRQDDGPKSAVDRYLNVPWLRPCTRSRCHDWCTGIYARHSGTSWCILAEEEIPKNFLETPVPAVTRCIS